MDAAAAAGEQLSKAEQSRITKLALGRGASAQLFTRLLHEGGGSGKCGFNPSFFCTEQKGRRTY
jgi:hypothetical protein